MTVSTCHHQIPSGQQYKLMSWTICCRRKTYSLIGLTYSPAPKEGGTWKWALAASTVLLWKSHKKLPCLRKRWWQSKAACLSAAVGTVCHGHTQSWVFTAHLQTTVQLWCSSREALILLSWGANYFLARLITVLAVISELLLQWTCIPTLKQNKDFLSQGFLCRKKRSWKHPTQSFCTFG